MSQEQITVVVTSNNKLSTRTLTFSKSWLAFVTGMTLLFGGLLGFVAFDYSQLLVKESKNKFLKVQNEDLKAQVKGYSEKMEAVQVDLEKINRFSRKLQAITATGEEHEKQLELSLGTPLIEEGDERSPSSLSTQTMEDRIPKRKTGGSWFPVFKTSKTSYSFMNPLDQADLTLSFEKTSVKAKRVEREVTLLFERIASQRDLLSATPSVRPTGGWLSSGFGYRTDPFTKRKKLHKGMDFAANIGTPIYAPADGTVSFAGREGGYGKIVSIDHGYGLVTRFAHTSRLLVKTGQKINRWDLIAEVGNTGRSSGPHLHYEVRLNGVPVNPEKYILSN
ncbi:MAG: M23 family metallopeptidase [Bdellovibrionales bacterium]